jgi:hypothetical protein
MVKAAMLQAPRSATIRARSASRPTPVSDDEVVGRGLERHLGHLALVHLHRDAALAQFLLELLHHHGGCGHAGAAHDEDLLLAHGIAILSARGLPAL